MTAGRAVVKKLASRALLIGGAALGLAYASRWVPREQTLVFELPSESEHAARLSVSWRHAGDREPLGGASFTLEKPPRRLTHHVSLPDGDYVVLLELSPIDGGNGAAARQSREGVETTWERRVTLRAGETVVVVAPDGS